MIEENSNLGDRKNMVYMGTMVTRGKAEVVVTAIGMGTEMGKIADLMQQSEEQLTPLQQRLDQLGKTLVWISLGITVLVVIAACCTVTRSTRCSSLASRWLLPPSQKGFRPLSPSRSPWACSG
ncbi:hypothetical protein GCM10025858_33400 [Alicyclobacillus sacchari]|nr:hypothetical protein GCM10025858_33400 [Alicyclobacillus sacchari]